MSETNKKFQKAFKLNVGKKKNFKKIVENKKKEI
jgi:hypothetical protein